MVLRTSKLSAGYSVEVVKEISVSVERGEIVAILGPNGAGKSTLLKTIASILRPLKGAVYIDGREVHSMKPAELAKKLSVTLTERINAGFMTGFEVVALGRYPYSDSFGRLREEDREVVMECLRLVNAEGLAEKPFSEMSDGERQKIMIARALAQSPEVMLLDEPTSFLDAKHRVEIMLLLRRIAAKGVAILMTTHDVELALRLCDRVVLLSSGEVVSLGSPEEVLRDDLLRKVYGTERAVFSRKTGAFEIRPERAESQVHVVCGAGSGVDVMRGLARRGIAFTAGVLHEGDVDCCVATACSSEVVVERAFREISEEKLERAVRLAEGKIVIDTGFPVTEMNEKNLRVLEAGDTVVSMRSEGKGEKERKTGLKKVIEVKSIQELLDVLEGMGVDR